MVETARTLACDVYAVSPSLVHAPAGAAAHRACGRCYGLTTPSKENHHVHTGRHHPHARRGTSRQTGAHLRRPHVDVRRVAHRELSSCERTHRCRRDTAGSCGIHREEHPRVLHPQLRRSEAERRDRGRQLAAGATRDGLHPRQRGGEGGARRRRVPRSSRQDGPATQPAHHRGGRRRREPVVRRMDRRSLGR